MREPGLWLEQQPDDLDLVQTMFLLTGVCPSRRAQDSYGQFGYQQRAAFERALLRGDLDGAEEIVRVMHRRTGALLWCANAERRIAHRRQRRRVGPID